ncbi:MAG: nucleotidyl transferase AbiEii/AbiGii toxin family protein [Pirellulales bacterium]
MKQYAYEDQLKLLLRILPQVAQEQCFSLKGGTAINLFVRDFPRLSVDIDLTYTPIEDRKASLLGIATALNRVHQRVLAAIPGVHAQPLLQAAEESKLVFQLGSANVKLEVNTTLRGTVWPTRELTIVDSVQDAFGFFASNHVVSHAELFGGKIAAALDRQHPRDLFDVNQLYRHDGISEEVVRGFLVALICHSRPMHELLLPNPINQRQTFTSQFEGMSRLIFTYDEFVETRDRLFREMRTRLTERDRAFLLSLKQGNPDWALAPAIGIETLPGVQWKLQNIRKLKANKAKHAEQFAKLKAVLTE